jgi:hypothetical protein
MRTICSVALALALLAGSSAESANAQSALTKRDGQGPVAVAVTLVQVSASATRARITLDTHSVPLDGIALDNSVRLRLADGAELGPTAVEGVSGAGHHRQAELVFPPADGASAIEIVVKNVGGVPSRSFRWALPLQ